MHNLEYLLHVLSERVRRETGNDDLANAAMRLATASHDYEPAREPEPLAEMCEDWHSRFDKHLTGEQKIKGRGFITNAQEFIVAAGKHAAEGAIALASGVGGTAAAAAATAATTASTAARVIFEKVAATIEATIPGPGAFTTAHESVVAGVRGVAKGAQSLAEDPDRLEKAALILDKIGIGIAASGKFKPHPYTPIVVAALNGSAEGVRTLARQPFILTATGAVLHKVATTIEPRNSRKGPA